MLKWWHDFWDRFLNNEAYFVARVRSAFGGAALLSVGFARDFATMSGWDWSERVLKVVGAIGLLVALLMRASGASAKGDAEQMEPPKGAT